MRNKKHCTYYLWKFSLFFESICKDLYNFTINWIYLRWSVLHSDIETVKANIFFDERKVYIFLNIVTDRINIPILIPLAIFHKTLAPKWIVNNICFYYFCKFYEVFFQFV